MKFCPKCGGMMIPTKKELKRLYVCSKCKYEEEIKEDLKGYKLVEEKSPDQKVYTTSIISESNSSVSLKEELEHEREEYYKEFGYDLIGSEEEEEESDEE
jgi:DNA-directed RNA polymerase subunit M